jgi:DNA-binding response OmpR family regulator
MHHAARILVVDDEKTLRDTLTFILQREGFSVVAVGDGVAALRAFHQDAPDLIVLDILLPELDGLQVCRTIRAESTVPIILLSARGEEFDRVLGLEIGADDYLTKPFAMRELVARVRAMLRRAGMPPRQIGVSGPAQTADTGSKEPVVAGDLVVDPLRRQVTLRGEPVSLKPMEFDLLLYLARRPTIVHSREALLRDVWGYDVPIDTRTVDVHVRWLRQKIEDDPSVPRRIETVRGHGYRFVPEPD